MEELDVPKLDEEQWVKDFVALLKVKAPPDKTEAELEEFAREMLAEAQRRGRAMSEIDTDEET